MTAPGAEPEIAPGVVRLARPEPSGWTVDALVVSLGDGETLVYGPTWLGDGTIERVERVGAPRVLVAPNHFHHLSLARYRAAWPRAVAVASDGARPRLARRGHEGIVGLEHAPVPSSVQLVPCEGVRNGETWVVISHGEGAAARRTLLVGDAFFHVAGPLRGPTGLALRALRTAPGLRLGRTFEWLGVRDAAAYRRFAVELLERTRPDVIAFAHGEPLVGPDASRSCIALLERHLGTTD